MMRRVFVGLSVLLLAAGASYAQSGRAKGSLGKYRVPPAPEASPQPDTVVSSKEKPPTIVDGERIYTSKEVDQKARITAKPTPGYTREARRSQTRGYVILRAILSADGSVKNIEVLTGLPDGLSEKAIEAARRIKFKPAMKDGKPVSAWVQVEYRFSVY